MEIADVSVHVTTKEFRDVFQTCSEEAPSRLESLKAAEMRCPLNLVQLSYKASSSSLHPLPSGGERVCPICQGEEGDLVALVGDKSDQVHVGSDNSGCGAGEGPGRKARVVGCGTISLYSGSSDCTS